VQFNVHTWVFLGEITWVTVILLIDTGDLYCIALRTSALGVSAVSYSETIWYCFMETWLGKIL